MSVKLQSEVKKALSYSKLRHIRDKTGQCSDKNPFNHGSFGCSRCELINLLTKKNNY